MRGSDLCRMRLEKENKPIEKPTKTKIRMDRPSGVAKNVVGISPLLHEKEPTLARPEHKEEFNNNNNKTISRNIFKGFKHVHKLTNA